MELEIKLVLYILLGAVAGMLYSLKRVLRMERLILAIDEKISKKLGVKTINVDKKINEVVRKRVTKKKPKKKAKKRKR